eukprot:15453776-Alexandrium_andersonii.AAC.1
MGGSAPLIERVAPASATSARGHFISWAVFDAGAGASCLIGPAPSPERSRRLIAPWLRCS